MTINENLKRVISANESWPTKEDRAEIAARTIDVIVAEESKECKCGAFLRKDGGCTFCDGSAETDR